LNLNPTLLTICIATYNRAAYLPATLGSLVHQLHDFDDVEVLVVDGNSTDDTEAVVARMRTTCPRLEYVKLPQKGGVDKDFDIAVRRSSGSYCWLFTDDDLLKDGAIAKVRQAALRGQDLIVVNAEICDYHLGRVLDERALKVREDARGEFRGGGREAFFKLCGRYITFIGAIVIRRSLWTEASRDTFFGTRFIHVGVISTLPDTTRFLVMAEPLIRIRLGNAEWTSISFKVWTELWPRLVWSFAALSSECKMAICSPEPWKSLKALLWHRALGTYSKRQYAEQIRPKPSSVHKAAAAFIAHVPRVVVRTMFLAYASLKGDRMRLYCLGDGGRTKNLWRSES
jgi:glycosyltransferase involved in cell wall biosynthesis